MKKHQPSFVAAITMPAIDGPSSRAALTIEELRAIALPRSSLFSMSATRNAWRPGMSNAFTTPWTTFNTRIASMEMRPLSVSTASANDCSIETVCVAMRSRRRSQRSMNSPAKGPRRNAGNWPAKPTSPRSSADPVSR